MKKIVKLKLKGGTKETHGGFSYLTTGRLPEHRREVERYLTAARAGLVRDLGPKEESLTTAQLILIDRAIGKLGILRCIEEFVRERKVFEGVEVAPCLRKSYLAYSNSLRLDLQALGLSERAVEREPTLAEIIREHDEEKAKVESAGAGGAVDQGADGEFKESTKGGEGDGSGGEVEP